MRCLGDVAFRPSALRRSAARHRRHLTGAGRPTGDIRRPDLAAAKLTVEREYSHKEARRKRLERRITQPLSLPSFDVGCFKRFNDLLGHLEGDDCLRRVAQTLAATTSGPRDFLACYGGEEFVLLPASDEAAAAAVADRCRQAVFKGPILQGNSPLGQLQTVSMGVGTAIPTAGQDPQIHRSGGPPAVPGEAGGPQPDRVRGLTSLAPPHCGDASKPYLPGRLRQQQHTDQQPVVDDVSAGRDPDVLRRHVAGQ